MGEYKPLAHYLENKDMVAVPKSTEIIQNFDAVKADLEVLRDEVLKNTRSGALSPRTNKLESEISHCKETIAKYKKIIEEGNAYKDDLDDLWIKFQDLSAERDTLDAKLREAVEMINISKSIARQVMQSMLTETTEEVQAEAPPVEEKPKPKRSTSPRVRLGSKSK